MAATQDPPFSEHLDLIPGKQLHKPATFCANPSFLVVPDWNIPEYLYHELSTSRLDRFYSHLWHAGYRLPARPLHRQILLGRRIFITETTQEHLLWHKENFFVKPMPDFLVDYQFWKTHIIKNEHLRKCAHGLLLSYVWLIAYESDFRVAKDIGIIHKEITWEAWTAFVEDFLKRTDQVSLVQVSLRYHYGELNLTHVTLINRILPTTASLSKVAFGYLQAPGWMAASISRHFAWFVAVFAFASVALSAFQVILATDGLGDHRIIEKAAYWFSVIVMAVLAALLVLVGIYIVFLAARFLSSRYVSERRTKKRMTRGTENPVVEDGIKDQL